MRGGSGPRARETALNEQCPICLGSLAAGGDVVRILCNHSFHGDCISKCLEISCPVCRFSYAPAAANQCLECDVRENLWMCLSCGFIGCSRQQWRGERQEVHSLGHALRFVDRCCMYG